jgi:hypothetical protein
MSQAIATHALLAGMPSVRFSDVAASRLDTISFFLLGYVLCACVIRWLWNRFARDSPALPRLSYRGAFAATAVWGILFLLVLTMISGARELLTPGAWERQGLTYRLDNDRNVATDDAETPAAAWPSDTERRAALGELRALLWALAAQPAQELPSRENAVAVASALWRQPGPIAAEYGYLGGTLGDPPRIVAFEQGVYPDSMQLVLLSDGLIRAATDGEIGRQLAAIPETMP